MASGSDCVDQIEVRWSSTEEAIENALSQDSDIHDIAAKLNNEVNIDPDREFIVDSSESIPQDSDTASNSSSLKDAEEIQETMDDISISSRSLKLEEPQKPLEKDSISSSNGSAKTNEKLLKPDDANRGSKRSLGSSASAKTSSDTDSVRGKQGCSPSHTRNPLKILKKLTKFDKSKKKPDHRSEFMSVVVDHLPQVFVVKYLGHRQVTGVCGLHHVRKPIDEMVGLVRTKVEEKTQVELPLLYVVVSPKGLDLQEHKSNRVKGTSPLGLMPIDFISYGVQDIKYWRVFTCIVVRELSSRTRVSTCHAFLCDSSHSGRKMALALGAAFNVYSKKLKSEGKMHNFQVELRPPDELADALDAECEA